MIFEWHSRKAVSNMRKHGVSFDEATTAFGDLRSITIPDPDHSVEEERYILLGKSLRGRLLVVAHTEQGDRIRLISARQASGPERRIYEEG